MATDDQPAAGGVVAGLDVGGTKMLGLLVDARDVVRARLQRPTPAGGNAAVRDGVLALLNDLFGLGTQSGLAMHAVAIGAPGYVDTPSGTLLDATNLGVRMLPLGPIVAAAFDVPALVLHDVKAAALCEARIGAATAAEQLAFVNVGTGVAVGLVLDGKLFYGKAGRAGELGHICLERDGPPCACGLHGCLEVLASGPALAAAARRAVADGPASMLLQLAHGDARRISAPIVGAAARQGDEVALGLIGRAAAYLGQAIAMLVNVLDLEHVVVGGGLSQLGPLLLEPIRAATDRYLLPEYRGRVPITLPGLGTDAGAIGAVLALREARVAGSKEFLSQEGA